MTFLGLSQTLFFVVFVGVFSPAIVVFALGISVVRQLHFKSYGADVALLQTAFA